MDLYQVIRKYHEAADEFSRGDPSPIKKLFSQQDDVTLANPFGPAVKGWMKVSQALDYASSRMRDGTVKEFRRIAEYQDTDLATILETEVWNSKVSGRKELTTFELRVTTTFRLENGDWKVIHRHADPIATAHPDGPLRSMGG